MRSTLRSRRAWRAASTAGKSSTPGARRMRGRRSSASARRRASRKACSRSSRGRWSEPQAPCGRLLDGKGCAAAQSTAMRKASKSASKKSHGTRREAKPAPPKVFLSHASEDKEFVLDFASRLRRRGVDVWLDRWEILPGDSFVDKIFDEGLAQAKAVKI